LPWETHHESFDSSAEASEDAELNLIPMIDIMSVLVAFLLVYSASRSGAELQGRRGAAVECRTQPKQSVLVMINKKVCSYRASSWRAPLMCATRKRCRSTLKAVLSRPMASAVTLAEQQAALSTREITVLADKSLPYEVVRK
jgi:biopolymer transport protein ExbD